MSSAAKKHEKTEEASAPTTAVVETEKGGELATIDFGADAGGGFQNVRPKDVALPFFTILQKGSPQVDDLSEKHIKGAKPGMVMNTVTGEVYPGDEGFPFIPCGFSPELIEWKPRDSGGGFVARHSENSPIVRQCTPDERGRLITPHQNVIIDTKYHFGVHPKSDGSLEWGIISMTSTQLKKSRNWLTMMKKLTMPDGREYPMYSHIYNLTTVGETKDKYSWYGWKIEMKEKISVLALYTYCREFAKAVAAGAVQVSTPPSVDEAEVGTDNGDGVPF